MVGAQTTWQLSGDYFENCNCDFLCPCLFNPAGPLAAPPTKGFCDAALCFHVDTGRYGDTALDGLNAVAALHADGPMGGGNWSVALYLDDRATPAQRDALQAIFSGSAGGAMEAFAPLIGTVVGVKSVTISYTRDGRRRSARIPNIMQLAIEGIPSMTPDEPAWVASGHPVAPEKLALATGLPGSTFSDYDMRWDNSGKNGHYAAIRWSNT